MSETRTIESVFATFAEFWSAAPYLWITIAVVVFIYGVIDFIRNAENPEARAEGRRLMIWAVIGLFTVVSIWGIIAVMTNTFVLENSADRAVDRLDTLFPY